MVMEIVTIENKVGSTKKALLYSLLTVLSFIYLYQAWNEPGITTPKVLSFLFVLVIVGLTYNQFDERAKSIILLSDGIMTTTLTGSELIEFSDINTLKFQFSETAPGFTRLRLLGPFGGDTLSTYFTYEIETQDTIYYDTLGKIGYEDINQFIDDLVDTFQIEPDIRQFERDDERGTIFYFATNKDKETSEDYLY